MGDFNTIGQDRGIIYTCNCGWFDRGHAFTAPSKRSHVGPFHLWNSLLKEDGPPEVIGRVPMPAFVVTYRQDAVKKVAGIALFPGVERQYVVRRGLSNVRKQGVALAILMDVSIAFDSLQSSLVSRPPTVGPSHHPGPDTNRRRAGLRLATRGRGP